MEIKSLGKVNDGALVGSSLLSFVGEDLDRSGIAETPQRFAKAWKEWTAGYEQNAEDVIKAFADGGDNYDEMVTVKNIPVYSMCEHHLAPIFGTATISYIPNGKVLGLSKMKRVLDVFARRLQVQERLTVQVADALYEHLAPKGVGVRLDCRHMCMESRGICTNGSHTVTTALRGALKEGEPRAEFLAEAS